MKKIALVSLVLIAASFLQAEEPVCHHCEEIREYNAAHHQNYEYYEDYIKSSQKTTEMNVKKTPETNGKKIAEKQR